MKNSVRDVRYRRKNVTAWVFLTPYLFIFTVFRFLPSIGSIGISLTDWKIVGHPNCIGLRNYAALLRDTNLHTALANTFWFLMIVLPALLFLSLFVAIALNNKLIRGRQVVTSIVITPYVMIPAVVGVMWNWIYEAHFGVLNYLRARAGLEKAGWLINRDLALPSVALVVIWSFLGYNMILYLAGLQGIDHQLYESAQIDGAGKWRQFTHITWPLLKPTTSLLITLTMINIVQVYDQVVVMTGGGPRGATMTLLPYQYIAGFERRNMGYSSAIGVIVLLILIGAILLQQHLFRDDPKG